MKHGALYFRIKDNGALVCRITEDAGRSRTDLVPVATAVLRTGDIRLHGDETLTAEETAEVTAWMAARQTQLAERKRAQVQDLAEDLGRAAHWIKTEATAEDIDAMGDALLWSMHDLRSAIVRRKADGTPKA